MIIESKKDLKELLQSVAEIAFRWMGGDDKVFPLEPNVSQVWEAYSYWLPKPGAHGKGSKEHNLAIELLAVSLIRSVLKVHASEMTFSEQSDTNQNARIYGFMAIMQEMAHETQPFSCNSRCAAKCVSFAFQNRIFFKKIYDAALDIDQGDFDSIHQKIKDIRRKICSQSINYQDESGQNDGG